jgi:hypothetical protein
MKQVTLRFPDLHLLWSFVQTLHSGNIVVNIKDITLSCHCAEKEITEAIEIFQASIIIDSSIVR